MRPRLTRRSAVLYFLTLCAAPGVTAAQQPADAAPVPSAPAAPAEPMANTEGTTPADPRAPSAWTRVEPRLEAREGTSSFRARKDSVTIRMSVLVLVLVVVILVLLIA